MTTNPVPVSTRASASTPELTPTALEARPRQIDDPAVATLSPATPAPAPEPFPLADLKIYFEARNRLLPVLCGVSNTGEPVHLKVRKSTRDSVLAQLDRGTYYVDYSYPAFIEEGGKIAGIPVLWVHLRPQPGATVSEDTIDEFYLLEHPYVEK